MLTMQYRLNRRSFIIAGGLTALASTRVLGANDTLRVGVIGAGGRMGDLLNAADKVGNYQIVAVSDGRDATPSNNDRTAARPRMWIIANYSSSSSMPFLSPLPTIGMCAWLSMQ